MTEVLTITVRRVLTAEQARLYNDSHVEREQQDLVDNLTSLFGDDCSVTTRYEVET